MTTEQKIISSRCCSKHFVNNRGQAVVCYSLQDCRMCAFKKPVEMAEIEEEEILDMAVGWIFSKGWTPKTLPSDEFRRMMEAFAAGFILAQETIRERLI